MAVTDNDGEFGQHLAALIKDSGLSMREIARRAGITEGTVRAYTRGFIERGGTKIPVPPTLSTVVKIADALETERAGLLTAAGLEAPKRVLAQQPRHGELSTAQLLELLTNRIEHLEEQARPALPPGELSAAQFRSRGHTIARLDTLAREAREAGDEIAATALDDLSGRLNSQLEAATSAQRHATGNPTPTRQ